MLDANAEKDNGVILSYEVYHYNIVSKQLLLFRTTFKVPNCFQHSNSLTLQKQLVGNFWTWQWITLQ